MEDTKQFQLGSISTGTLRTEDLLMAFRNALSRLGYDTQLPLIEETCVVIQNKDFTKKRAPDLLAQLSDALQELCPPFVYFGAHPSDGADFGFWIDFDAITEANLDGVNEFETNRVIVYFHDTPSSDVTLMDMDRNVLWSTV